MIRTIAVFALFLACASARNITFDNCSPNGEILWVNVVPCDSDKCSFQAGSKVKMNGELVTSITSSKPTLKSEIKMDGEWVGYSDINSDACLYTKCPIKANEVTQFALELNVYSWPKSFETEMRFRVIGDDETTQLACGKTAVSVIKN